MHYGLSAAYLGDSEAQEVTRHGVKVLTMVQGIARTTSKDCGSGKEVSTKVRDPFQETTESILRTYCDASRELDYKLDRQAAIVSVTGSTDNTMEIDAVTLIGPQQTTQCKELMTKWLHVCHLIGDKESLRADLKRKTIEMTPSKHRKCRSLASTPSDPKEPGQSLM